MKRELQDYVWSVLPKEFKEEVKYKYNKTKTKKIKKECDLGFLNAHEGMFGVHNLTSDTEGEEMLTVSRKKVQEEYAIISEELSYHDAGTKDYKAWNYIKITFEDLFGSKCLPDNVDSLESKPAEPTANYVQVDYHGADTAASTIADGCQPVTDCHDFDRIIKDGFRGHNRLHISAMLLSSILAGPPQRYPIKRALELADALIAECEKGDNHA